MEISLKHLKKLADKFVAAEEETSWRGGGGSYGYTCWPSTRLEAGKKLTINGFLCLHRRNYQLIVCDQTGWCYIQFLNLTTSDQSTDARPALRRLLKIDELVVRRVFVEAFNLVVESMVTSTSNNNNNNNNNNNHNSNFSPRRHIVYIQTDLNRCRFDDSSSPSLSSSSLQLDLFAADCLKSAQITYELLRLHRNQESDQFRNECWLRVDHVAPIMSTMNSTISRQLNVKLRAHLKVCLFDPSTSSSSSKQRPFYVIITLLGRHLFYYNFMHVGGVYLLKSEKPISTYLAGFLSSGSSGFDMINSASSSVSDKPVKSIMTWDDSMRLIQDAQLPAKFKTIFKNETDNFNQPFDPNLDSIDHMVGILVEKRITNYNFQFNNSSTASSEAATSQNQKLADYFDLMLPNRDLQLIVRPLNSSSSIVVYFETRLSLYELGILPGMLVSLVNLTRKQTDRSICYKTSNHLKPVFDQRAPFLTVDMSDPVAAVVPSIAYPVPPTLSTPTKTVVGGKKKTSLYDNLLRMNSIYDCFYKLDSNPINGENSSTGILETNNADRLKLYFNTSSSCNQPDDPQLQQQQSIDSNSSSCFRILAQITHIYGLHLKITCRKCTRLWNACQCDMAGAAVHEGKEGEEDRRSSKSMRVQMSATFQVDDHTSCLRLTYATTNFDARFPSQSSVFGRMGDALVRMLAEHLAEINMPSIPLGGGQQSSLADALDAAESRLFEAIQERVFLGTTAIGVSGNVTGNASLSTSSSMEGLSDDPFNLVKMDIYKAVYDYVYHTCVDNYFVFYIDPLDYLNARKMNSSSVRSSVNNNNNNNTSPYKSGSNYVRLGDVVAVGSNNGEQQQQWARKQPSSMLTLRCFKFVPIGVDLGDGFIC